MTRVTASVIQAVGPAKWPPPPAELSISALHELETCPRRWALGNAQYPGIWNRSGYPPKLKSAALAGSVVHRGIATITKRLACTGCPSVNDPAAVIVMKELGGYTKVSRDCVNRVLERFEGNPRVEPVLETTRGRLESRIPELRTRIQGLLSRLQLQAVVPATRVETFDSGGDRSPLRSGSHAEVLLRTRDLGWLGVADLINLGKDGCEIRDFKTGRESEEHAFQLRVYALLWWRDTELNPTARRADSLVLSYSSGDVSVAAPGQTELELLERELIDRSQAARGAVDVKPPEARPSLLNCRYCDVRHLCGDYWQRRTQQRLAQESDTGDTYGDIQLVIESRHGPTSWDTRVEVARTLTRGKDLLLRVTSDEPGFKLGDHIRVLDIHLTLPEGDDVGQTEPVVGTMGAISEAFIVHAAGIG